MQIYVRLNPEVKYIQLSKTNKRIPQQRQAQDQMASLVNFTLPFKRRVLKEELMPILLNSSQNLKKTDTPKFILQDQCYSDTKVR